MTLGELQKRVNELVAEQGPDVPVMQCCEETRDAYLDTKNVSVDMLYQCVGTTGNGTPATPL